MFPKSVLIRFNHDHIKLIRDKISGVWNGYIYRENVAAFRISQKF